MTHSYIILAIYPKDSMSYHKDSGHHVKCCIIHNSKEVMVILEVHQQMVKVCYLYTADFNHL